MITESPDYYSEFECLAGDCPDTCCAGWEIEVDEESYYRYQVVKNPIGDQLRRGLEEQEDGKFFRLTPEKRCPFLNRENLCKLYIALGPEYLCETCREHPRFFTEVGPYEQVDVSLSCPETVQLFFQDPGHWETFKREDERPYDELEESDEQRLWTVLQERDNLIARGDWGKPSSGWLSPFREMEPLDHRWHDLMGRLSEDMYPDVENVSVDSRWFAKLYSYFMFRYGLDAWFDGSMEPEIRMAERSLWFLQILAVDCQRQLGGAFQMEDFKEAVSFYCRQVEFSEYNTNLLKEI